MYVARDENEFSTFRSNWDSFLGALDQLWNRMNAYAKNHVEIESLKKTAQGFLGQINSKRTKEDELLIYLDKARNSAHHTLWKHIRPSNVKEIVSDAEGVIIDTITGLLTLRSNSGGKVSEVVLLNEGVILLQEVQVVERKEKKIYMLPDSHAGQALYPLDRVLPQMIGQKGLLFYRNTLNTLLTKSKPA
jgi:hypothetical protein